MSTSVEDNNLQLTTAGFTDEPEAVVDQDLALAMTLLRTVIPVIVLMGTIGNTLSFCVLLRRRMRSTPMYFYLTLLAIADTFVLYVSAFKVWIRAVTRFEVLHVSNVGCKMFMFILLCSFYMSAWLVVLVTMDRFLVVWFPFRGYLFMRIRRARLTAAMLAVVVAVYNVHVFWTMSLYQYESNPTCDAAEDNFFMMHIFEYLKLISYCAVPFVIVTALNVAILVKINKVYTNVVMRQDGGLRNTPATYRHQPPMVVLGGPPSTPIPGNVDNTASRVVWAQRQQLAISGSGSSSSANRSQSPLNVQKLRQRRLTRILLFISFAWLALTAPFTLHSFLPGPSTSSSSSSSSSSANANFFEVTTSVSTMPTVGQSVNSGDADNSTFDKFLHHNNHEISESTFELNRLRETATKSFLADEHHSYTLSTSASTTSPPASINPSRYLLVKTICFLLMYLNHAINFYLYCLTGKRFRRELAEMLNCGRTPLLCVQRDDEADAAVAVAAAGPVVREMAVLNGQRDVHPHQPHAGRMPLNQAQPNSTSSRSRSGRGMRKSNFVDERYS